MEEATVRRRPSSPTIYDVAELAGVSASTVSRSLNMPGRMRPGTERRVREAADALGYRLNPVARWLQTGQTGNIALIMSDITNPVYFSFVRGAERVTAEAGSTLLFADCRERADIESATAERMLRAADGIVLVGSRLEDERIVELAGAKPLITVNRVVEGLPNTSMDVRSGIEQMLDHLHDLGHRRLTYLSGPPTSWMNAQRQRAASEGALKRSMQVARVPAHGATIDAGQRAVGAVLASGASAVLAYNDLLAFGLLQGAEERGLDVPGALSVIGFDDIFGADLITPSLTTIRSPMSLVGEHAVRTVLREIGGEPPQEIPALSTEAIVRESSGPAPRRAAERGLRVGSRSAPPETTKGPS